LTPVKSGFFKGPRRPVDSGYARLKIIESLKDFRSNQGEKSSSVKFFKVMV